MLRKHYYLCTYRFSFDQVIFIMIINHLPLSTELKLELDNILSYWKNKTIDVEYGGFIGKIDETDTIVAKADKGLVLNARILWSFSAAYNLNQQQDDLEIAKRSFDYINQNFIDRNFGGVYWTVDFKGNPKEKKKQIYALAFTIYALAEYYISCDQPEVLTLAKSLYFDIEKYSYDKENGGYFEAFAEDWTDLKDLRLSGKDANEKKTMNTHLHVLEAYTLLYKIWPDQELKKQIENLLGIFKLHIINQNHHLDLFFDEEWTSKSDIISFGHDIEASWLLLEAAKSIQDDKMIKEFESLALKIADAAAEGIDDQAMIYEFEPSKLKYISEKHWWVQAEAMVGFLNAFQISGDEKYFQIFIKIWTYTKSLMIDHINGEWFWGRNIDETLMKGQDKAGLWKCPYHNSRACMEIIIRLNS